MINSVANLMGLTITEGNGSLSGNGSSGGVYVAGNSSVTISNTRIISNAGGGSGGVEIDGANAVLTISHSYIGDNQAVRGSGIRNDGDTVYIYHSQISNNLSDLGATAIYNRNGLVVVDSSTVANNIAANGNPAVNSYDTGAFIATNSTFSGNSAGLRTQNGGAITLTHSTVVSNTGYGLSGNRNTIINSLFAHNGGSDCVIGTNFTDGGYNLMQDTGAAACNLVDGS